MQLNFSTISRMLYLVITISVLSFLGKVAYGWSLDETQKFSVLIFGNDYARAASWIIQLGPNALFLLAGLTSNRRVKRMALISAIVLNFVDGYTNFGAYRQWISVSQGEDFLAQGNGPADPMVRQMAEYLGYAACFAVTLAEEIFVLLIGVAFHLLSLLGKDFGRKMPKWFAVDAINLAQAASGAGHIGVDISTSPQEYQSNPPSNGKRPTRQTDKQQTAPAPVTAHAVQTRQAQGRRQWPG